MFPIPYSPSPNTQQRIAILLAEAERRWGRGVLVRWGDTVEAGEVETIPTGFADLDEALGVGGLPCGRISELFGADSSGKHALSASIVAQCQRQEGVAVWIDPAGRLDPEQMRVLGVDLDSLLVARPRNEFEALEMAVRLARSGGVRLIIFDLANSEQRTAISRTRIENRESRFGSWPNSSPITHHPSLNLALRRLVAAVHRNRIAFLFIADLANSEQRTASRRELSVISHQSSAGRGSGNGNRESGERLGTQNPEPGTRTTGDGRDACAPPITHYSSLITPLSPHRSRGGQALRYFASVRLEIEKRQWIRCDKEVVGCRSAVRVVKNKLAAPHREAEVDLRFYPFPRPRVARVGLSYAN